MAKGTGQGSGRSTEHGLKVRVKTSKGRKIGSTLWLQRQLNDPYVAKARAEGYRSRAAFKLIELNDRYKLLRKGQRIVDRSEVLATLSDLHQANPPLAPADEFVHPQVPRGKPPPSPRGHPRAVRLLPKSRDFH